MESFQSDTSELYEVSECYNFPRNNLENISYPDDSVDDSSNLMAEVIELPPPPGAQDNELESFQLNKQCMTANNFPKFSPPSPKELSRPEDAADIPVPPNVNNNEGKLSSFLPLNPGQDNQQSCLSPKTNKNPSVTETETKKIEDDNKYSPSKVDSDDENQDFALVKPKVLGKEQAKKRLMAFSLSKQTNATLKKQNKINTSMKVCKEKPPNPNKSSGVQEQFRATISAIEEEKKKMMQNMPNYLLVEMSDLSKNSHPITRNSIPISEKQKNESGDFNGRNNSVKEKDQSNKSRRRSKEKDSYKKMNRRSRSKSRSIQRSHSRRKKTGESRSKSRTNRKSPSVIRKRSRDRSRSKKEKNNLKSDKKSENSFLKKESSENWKNFLSTKEISDINSGTSKQLSEEAHLLKKDELDRPCSPKSPRNFKPIFSYLKKNHKTMGPLLVKPVDHGKSTGLLFSEKTVKYTKTKPFIIWTENPSFATDFYMPKQMLLENCDEATASIIQSITKNKTQIHPMTENFLGTDNNKSRQWYSQLDYLRCRASPCHNELKDTCLNNSSKNSDKNFNNQSIEKYDTEAKINKNSKADSEDKNEKDKYVSLVNDSYMSDEEELVSEGLKVQSNLNKNCVKVRSKWDSDYEGESIENMFISNKSNKEVDSSDKLDSALITSRDSINDSNIKLSVLSTRNESNVKVEESLTPLATPSPLIHVQNTQFIDSEAPTKKLVSEYEEFLKMVSFDSNSEQNSQGREVTATAPLLETKSEKQEEKNQRENLGYNFKKNFKLEATDWDQESDHEEKNIVEKKIFNKNDGHEKVFLKMEENSKKKKKKVKKKSFSKKKIEKCGKSKSLKLTTKRNKKKYEESSSSGSSSDSQMSETDSDLNDCKVDKKKKKKKKISKTKKKLRKTSTSETDSDTDDFKYTKKRSKKKRNIKKKKNASSDSEEEMENALLKQLDFKKQMIIKKLEEIDSISEKSGKKKEKDVSQKKKGKENMEDVELLEKFLESSKKKKDLIKMSKKSMKHKSVYKKDVTDKSVNEERKDVTSSESDSGSSEFEIKKKNKKKEKRKFDSSDSNSNKEKVLKNTQKKLMNIKNLKSFEEEDKKTNKLKKKKKKSFSSTDSENDIGLSNENKKIKIKKNKKGGDLMVDDGETGQCNWEENLEVDKKNFKKVEKRFGWKTRKMPWVRSDRKNKISKDNDDWEASSSFEEAKSTESSWDDEAPRSCNKPGIPKDFTSTNENLFKEECSKGIVLQKEVNEKGILKSPETNQEFASENLKNSLSNFSFNESSFCGFGQELSRDFFLNELNFSNSSNLPGTAINTNSSIIQARPFQSVTINSDMKKPQQSELYSPGYSDSEDTDAATETVSKYDKNNSNTSTSVSKKEDIYDPLNCESEGSVENNEIELSSIPLPQVSEILLPGETRNFSSEGKFVAKDVSFINTTQNDIKKGEGLLNSPSNISFQITKNCFNSNDIVTFQNSGSNAKFTQKKQVISVKAQQKLKSKAAPVFQDESEDENFEISEKTKAKESNQKQNLEALEKKLLDYPNNNKPKSFEEDEAKEKEKEKYKRVKNSDHYGNKNKEMNRKRSSSREKKIFAKSPKNKRSRTPDSRTLIFREKREIKSDSFEIEPLKTSTDFNELEQTVQTIPVLTGLGVSSSEKIWNASHLLGYTCSDYSELSENIINHAESFDIYPSEDSKSRNLDKNFTDRDAESREKSMNIGEKNRKEKRKSRSRSLSPRKRRRSKSPTRRRSPRNRSPKRRSLSPKRRERSPYSPRRRSSPKKSPRRYRTSRSPDRRKKSRSRSPRKKRSSPLKRSHSISPRKHRSPKRRLDSPRKMDSPSKIFSPRGSVSPRKESHYSHCSGTFQNRIPVIGASCDDSMKLNSPRFETPMGFPGLITDSVIDESDMNNPFYNREFGDEFGIANYTTESGTNNLITVKSHVGEKTNSPERLSLDQRIELELGVQISSGSQSQNEQYQPCSQFQDPNHFQNTYTCDNGNSNDSFYPHQNMQIPPDFNESYFNNHQQPSNYSSFQQYSNSQPVQSSVMQVGNIVEVVPASQHPPTSVLPKPHQIMQVGNVLQVVPSSKVPPSQSALSPATTGYGLPSNSAPLIKTQKATAVVAPSSITPTPNPEAVMNPLIKAIQMEREKRKKEKDKRKTEREARRKARQLRREAKLMSVNEKLKKSVQDEGLMLGQEVEDDELLETTDLPSPPIPVEIITISSQDTLPAAGKGILITAGFMPKPPSEKKEVKFADGVCPGEGTSTSGGEDIGSPLPKPKLPKEKRYKKKKTKVKKKVKVQIIRQIIQDEDDDDEDDLSPPPPPPGSPPPVFFARFPFACDAQFPVYQTQTTTTTLTTVQYQTQPFQ